MSLIFGEWKKQVGATPSSETPEYATFWNDFGVASAIHLPTVAQIVKGELSLPGISREVAEEALVEYHLNPPK